MAPQPGNGRRPDGIAARGARTAGRVLLRRNILPFLSRKTVRMNEKLHLAITAGVFALILVYVIATMILQPI